MLLTEFVDPTLQLVTITSVQMTGDLQHADIFYSVISRDERESDQELQESVQKALNKGSGRLRTAVAKKLGTRLAPTLKFKLDTLEDRVMSIEELLQKAAMADHQLAKDREGKEYAGDADAYKAPRQPKLVDADSLDVPTDAPDDEE